MSYLEILNKIKKVIESQPNINSVVRSFEDLNREDARYSAGIIQDQTHSRDENFMTYVFYIGYADRLTSDRKNEDFIWSTGISLLNRIVNQLNTEYDVTLSGITNVTQKFLAECAVSYGTFSISVPVTDCYDEFEGGAFSDDYNQDFDIIK